MRRGRFREAGPEAVSDYELLELVLFRAIPQHDIKPPDISVHDHIIVGKEGHASFKGLKLI